MQAPLSSLFVAFLLGTWVARQRLDQAAGLPTSMARKLKTFQTSLGFYDLAIAAPSMKAALEAKASKVSGHIAPMSGLQNDRLRTTSAPIRTS